MGSATVVMTAPPPLLPPLRSPLVTALSAAKAQAAGTPIPLPPVQIALAAASDGPSADTVALDHRDSKAATAAVSIDRGQDDTVKEAGLPRADRPAASAPVA